MCKFELDSFINPRMSALPDSLGFTVRPASAKSNLSLPIRQESKLLRTMGLDLLKRSPSFEALLFEIRSQYLFQLLS